MPLKGIGAVSANLHKLGNVLKEQQQKNKRNYKR